MKAWTNVKVAAVVVLVLSMLSVGIWAGAAGSATRPVAAVGALPATTAATGKLQVPRIDELLARLEESRKAVVRVHVRGGYRLQVREQGADQWRETPCMADAEAWIELQPVLRFRCDSDLTVTQWVRGAAPYSAERSCKTWDGQQGLYRITGSAPYDGITLKALAPRKEDHPLDGKDKQVLLSMDSQFAAGLPFAEQLEPTMATHSCLDVVRMLVSAGSQLKGRVSWKIDTVEMADEERVHLQITAPRQQDDYWFSPAHGWLCCRYECRGLTDDKKLLIEWEVEKFAGLGKASYPARAVKVWGEMPDPSGGGKVRAERITYEADLVEVNPKAFDDATFRQ